ncbi:MAG TPA: terminase gpA endonuclease subunit [Solimonas sp.]
MIAFDLEEQQLRAELLVAEILAKFLAPPPRVSVWEWAAQYRHIAKGPERGRWRNERTPYLVEPMECASSHSLYEQVVLMFATQMGKTEVLYNALCQRIHTQPQDMMMVQPTLQDAQDHSSKRFLPTVLETPILQGLVATKKSRDESTSWRSRSIQGNFAVFFAGANSASSIASKPLGFAVADEVDLWPADVDNQGPPLGLLMERMSNFARRKLLIASTPSIKDASEVERRYQASDRRKYFVPCPHCGEPQVLVWGENQDYGIKWLKTPAGDPRPETAVYICRCCGAAIQEHSKTDMLAAGAWRAEVPGAARGKVAGFWINKLYSPLGWRSWAELVEEWVQAIEQYRIGNNGALKKFRNASLAETFKESGSGADHKDLANRAEPYETGVVPRRGLMLTMGVDTQPDRLEARLYAYGRGEESWLLARHIVYGDPNVEEGQPGSPWTELTRIRRTPLQHEGGTQMFIEATGIDIQGHNTDAVYKYCREHAHENVLAMRGDKDIGGPILKRPKLIDVTWRGSTIKNGVKLWNVCVDTAKHVFYGRLKLSSAGPGFIHVPEALKHTDEFEQMCAERLMPTISAGKKVMRWINPPGKRNEGLDCAIYAYAAACYLGIQNYREPGWARRELRFCPARDLFTPVDTYPSPQAAQRPAAPAAAAKPAPAPQPPAPGRQFKREW